MLLLQDITDVSTAFRKTIWSIGIGSLISGGLLIILFYIILGHIERALETSSESLRKSKESLMEAQRLAHIGSWDHNLVTDALNWSDEVYRIFEIDPNTFGASYEAFLDAVHPDDKEVVDKAYKDSAKNKTPYDIDHRLLMKDGRSTHL